MSAPATLKVVVIPVDPTDACYVQLIVSSGDHARLQGMQAIVGGLIECVSTDRGDLWLNEEGKLISLEPNMRATAFVDGILFPGDYIAGQAFVTGPVDEEGECTDVTDEVVAELVPDA